MEEFTRNLVDLIAAFIVLKWLYNRVRSLKD
jgi:hypothetical protein